MVLSRRPEEKRVTAGNHSSPIGQSCCQQNRWPRSGAGLTAVPIWKVHCTKQDQAGAGCIRAKGKMYVIWERSMYLPWMCQWLCTSVGGEAQIWQVQLGLIFPSKKCESIDAHGQKLCCNLVKRGSPALLQTVLEPVSPVSPAFCFYVLCCSYYGKN